MSKDYTKMTVFILYSDTEAMIPNQVYVVQGTDDPVELEFLLEEREDLSELPDYVPSEDHEEGDPEYQDAVKFLTDRGYVLTPIKHVLLKAPYDDHMSHQLDWGGSVDE